MEFITDKIHKDVWKMSQKRINDEGFIHFDSLPQAAAPNTHTGTCVRTPLVFNAPQKGRHAHTVLSESNGINVVEGYKTSLQVILSVFAAHRLGRHPSCFHLRSRSKLISAQKS